MVYNSGKLDPVPMKIFSAYIRKWHPLLSKYGVFILALAVSLNHLRLRHEGISSWKGGGFGMYAGMHPIYTKVFIKSRSGKAPNRQIQPSEKAIKLMAKARIYPTNSTLEQLKQEYRRLSGQQDLLVQIWVPVFNPDTGEFKMIMKKQY